MCALIYQLEISNYTRVQRPCILYIWCFPVFQFYIFLSSSSIHKFMTVLSCANTLPLLNMWYLVFIKYSFLSSLAEEEVKALTLTKHWGL